MTSKLPDEAEFLIEDVGETKSLFSFMEIFCRHKGANPAVHRLCTLMRNMGVQTATIEPLKIFTADLKTEADALDAEIDQTFNGLKNDLNRKCPNIGAKMNMEKGLEVFRVSFFSTSFKDTAQFKNVNSKDLLSTSIVINFRLPIFENFNFSWEWRTYIFNSYVAVPKRKVAIKLENSGDKNIEIEMPLTNHYIHIRKKFRCQVGKRRFEILGTFFCQQNTLTSQCAQSALCMVINNMDPTIFEVAFKKITPQSINQEMERINKRLKPSDIANKGLKTQQIRQYLDNYGLNYKEIRLSDFPNEDYNDWIYNYVESKYPVMLVFEALGESHVITILGHTLNPDSWRPEAQHSYSKKIIFDERQQYKLFYNSASQWVDNFIIHDDNFGIYSTMPVDTFKKITIPKHDPMFRAWYALAILPPGVRTSKEEVEKACIELVYSFLASSLQVGVQLDPWSERLISSIAKLDAQSGKVIIHLKRQWVIRTFIIKKENYIDSLGKLRNEQPGDRNFTDEEIREIGKALPRRFWISEVSLPDLYSGNRSKIVDFFYRCDTSALREGMEEAGVEKRWIQVRFPKILSRRKSTRWPDEYIFANAKSHIPMVEFESDLD